MEWEDQDADEKDLSGYALEIVCVYFSSPPSHQKRCEIVYIMFLKNTYACISVSICLTTLTAYELREPAIRS